MSAAPAVSACRAAACALDICLTDRCNMGCRYCYYETLNRGAARSLSFEQVRSGLDAYLEGRRPESLEKIVIAGGEPFLCFDTLERTASYVRRRAGGEVKLEVFTNGTLLDAEKARRLSALGVRIVVSLDGRRGSNDRNRVFAGGRRGSAFGAVTRNLEKLPPELLRGMYAGMTVTAETAAGLAANVAFVRGLGFREAQLNMKYLELWDEKDLAALSRGLRALRKYYRRLALSEMRSFGDFRFGLDFLQLKEEGVPLSCLPGFREISLGPDGFFYPCGLVTTYGAKASGYRIGDIRSGPDYTKAARLRAAAARFLKRVDRRHGLTEYVSNPILLYFGIKLRGLAPDALFRSTLAVHRAFYGELGQYLRAEKIMSALCRDREFGDMTHRPPSVSRRELRRLEADLRAGGGAASFRDRLDHFLYSPGRAKELEFHIPAAPERFAVFELLAFYAMLKAAALGKKLTVRAALEGRLPDPGEAGFLSAHGVAAGPRGVAPRGGSRLFRHDGGEGGGCLRE